MIVSICSLPGFLLGAVVILFLPTSLLWVCVTLATLCLQLEESFCSKCCVGGVLPPLSKPSAPPGMELGCEGVAPDLVLFAFPGLSAPSRCFGRTQVCFKESEEGAACGLGVSEGQQLINDGSVISGTWVFASARFTSILS